MFQGIDKLSSPPIHYQFKYFEHFITRNKSKCNPNLEVIKMKADESFFDKSNKNAQIMIVVEGNGGITINGNGFLIETGDIFYVPENSLRVIANVEAKELRVILINLDS